MGSDVLMAPDGPGDVMVADKLFRSHKTPAPPPLSLPLHPLHEMNEND